MDFRVRAEMLDGRPVAEELFSTRREADAFVESLMQDGSVLDGLGMTITLAVEEMCNGSWTVASRRLVRC